MSHAGPKLAGGRFFAPGHNILGAAKLWTHFNIFKLISNLEEGYPNSTTALQIFLTFPVTITSGERSFSTLA